MIQPVLASYQITLPVLGRCCNAPCLALWLRAEKKGAIVVFNSEEMKGIRCKAVPRIRDKKIFYRGNEHIPSLYAYQASLQPDGLLSPNQNGAAYESFLAPRTPKRMEKNYVLNGGTVPCKIGLPTSACRRPRCACITLYRNVMQISTGPLRPRISVSQGLVFYYTYCTFREYKRA